MAVNDSNRRRKFYDQLSTDYDLGSFEEFDSKMNDAASRRRLYDAISSDGIYDIGTFDYFDEAMRPVAAPSQSGGGAATLSQQSGQAAETASGAGSSPVSKDAGGGQTFEVGGNGYTFTEEQLRKMEEGQRPVMTAGDSTSGGQLPDVHDGQATPATTPAVDDGDASRYGSEAWKNAMVGDESNSAVVVGKGREGSADAIATDATGVKANPYRGMTRQHALNAVGNKFFNEWYGTPGAFSKMREELASYGITPPGDYGRAMADIRNSYVRPVARQRVEQLMGGFQRANREDLEEIRGKLESRETQKAIDEDLERLGIVDTSEMYEDEEAKKKAMADYRQQKDAYYSELGRQLEGLLTEKYGYLPAEDARSSVHSVSASLLGSSADEQEGRILRREYAERIGGRYAAAIGQAFEQAEKRGAAAESEAMVGAGHDVVPGMTSQGALLGQSLSARRSGNEERDPDKILGKLLDAASSPGLLLAEDPKLLEDVWKDANAKGMDINDYIEQYVVPAVQDGITRRFEQEAVRRELPRSTAEYVLRGLEDSLPGMIVSGLLNTESQQRYRNMANAQYGEDAGLLANAARTTVGFVADAPLWAGWGKIGGAVAKQQMAEYMMNEAARRGVSLQVIQRAMQESANHYLGSAVGQRLMQGVPQMAITMGGAQATSELVRGIRDREELGTIIGNTLGTAVSEGIKGGAVGAFTGAAHPFVDRLSGIGKVAGKAGSFAGEAGVFYTAGEIEKLAKGEDAFGQPLEGLAESALNLALIKLTNIDNIRRYADVFAHPKKALEAKKGELTDEDVAIVRENSDGAAFIDAITSMRPARTVPGAGEREGELSAEEVNAGAESYRKMMVNPDIPFGTKQKVARIVDGILPPPGKAVTAEVVPSGEAAGTEDMRDNGSAGGWLLRTRDIDGQLLEERRFEGREEAEEAADGMRGDLFANTTEALEGKVNATDAYRRFTDYFEEAYKKASEKLLRGEELTKAEQQAIYLFQHQDELLDIYKAVEADEELGEDGQDLADLYRQHFEGYVRTGKALKAFTEEYEREHGLSPGSLHKALEKDIRTEEEVQMLLDYQKAMREHLAVEPSGEAAGMDGSRRSAEEADATDVTGQRMLDVRGIGGSDDYADGEAGANDGTGADDPSAHPAGEAAGTGAGTAGEAAGSAPRAARREAAYQRGANALQEQGTLSAVNYDLKLSIARMERLFPAGDPVLSRLRSDVMKAVEDGNDAEADRLIATNAGVLNDQQREAIEQWRDMTEASRGLDDAITQQAAEYEQQRRQVLQPLAAPDGSITELELSDGSRAYYLAGNLNNTLVGVMVADETGARRQIPVNQVRNIGERRMLDNVITADVDEYVHLMEQQIEGFANGADFMAGSEVDLMVAGRPFHVTVTGKDAAGNILFRMEDGSQLPMSGSDARRAVYEADKEKIDAQLRQEAEAATLSRQRERFGKGIVGFAEGRPDLTAEGSNPKVVAEYLESSAAGNASGHAEVLRSIQTEIERTEEDANAAADALRALGDMEVLNDGLSEAEQSEKASAERTIAEARQRRRKWGEIRQALMSDEERRKFEDGRQKEIRKAQEAARKGTDAGLSAGEAVPTGQELLSQYQQQGDAERAVEELRKEAARQWREELFPALDGVRKALADYQHGLADYSSEELAALATRQGELESERNTLVKRSKELKSLSQGLGKLYAARNAAQLTPHERKMAQLEKEGNREKKLKIAREAFGDDPEALAILDDAEPQDIYEYVAANLGQGSINWEGMQRGEHYVRGLRDELGRDKTRGLGKGSDTFGFNYFLAPEGKGKGIDEVVHSIWEGSPYDEQDVKNTLLEMLNSARKPTDISHRIVDDRIQRAEDAYEANQEREREAEDAAIMQMTGMSPEEYDAFIGDLEQRLAAQEGYQSSEEYFNQIAEDNDRENERRAGGGQEAGALAEQGQEGEPVAAASAGKGGAGAAGVTYRLSSTEKDAEGNSFYEKNGSVNLWSLPDLFAKARRQSAPIRLTDRNLQHIIKEHHKEIGDADSVFAFLDDVFANATTLRRARGRAMFVVVENDNTDKAAIIKLMPSDDGDYYNVETAGYYRKSKWKNDEDVIAELSEPAQSDAASDASKPQAPDINGGEPINAEAQTSSSASKGTNNSSNGQEKAVKSSIQGLEDYSEDEIKGFVREFFDAVREENGVDAEIVDMRIIGSRTTGNAKPDSDLDILLEYRGKEREDDLFNMLADADEPLVINGITVDINPITKGKSGTIDEFLERNADYRKEPATFSARLAEAKKEVNVSPTEGQKEAGNYKKGHISFGGYDYTIENPKGSIRSGVDRSGRAWSVTMQDTYGYIGRKYGADGDHLDFFINDDADLDSWDGRVYVVDQKSEGGSFDEHKVMYGYPNWIAARRAYERNYEPGWWDSHVMQMTGVKKEDFDKWLADSDHKLKPFAEYVRTKNADPISDSVDQLIADVRERVSQLPTWEADEIEGMDAERLTQLLKKRRKDLSTSRYLLKAAGVEGSGSAKERLLKNSISKYDADIKALEAEQQRREHRQEEEGYGGADFVMEDNPAGEAAGTTAEKRGGNTFQFGRNFVTLQSQESREAVKGQKATLARTAPWREGVEDVTVHTTLSTVRKKYGELHEKAKAGDVKAAKEFVSAIVKPEKVKALAEQHPNARVAYVHAEEATGKNKIPRTYAREFAKLGLSLADGIIQTNKPAHTGSDRVGRFIRRARFDGEVEPGAEYIIVDDHVTMGSTLRDLKDYIESKGGKVVAVSTLTASAGGTKLRPTEEQIRQLNEKAITNEQLRELGIADSIDGLTRREAAEVLVLADRGGERGTAQGFHGLFGHGNRRLQGGEGQIRGSTGESSIDSTGEATIVSMPRINQFGLNENDPVGRTLTGIKQANGEHTLAGYLDAGSKAFLFMGKDAGAVHRDAYRKGTLEKLNGVERLSVPETEFDVVLPILVRKGYKVGIADKISEGQPKATVRSSRVKSIVQTELFSDKDFEDAGASAIGLPGNGRSNELTSMSDEELLKAIGENEEKERGFHIDEYDRRYRKEYDEVSQAYLQMLEEGGTSLDDAYSMYGDTKKQWADNGGYATPERTQLLAQIDALEAYIEEKEAERMEREAENEEGAATLLQQREQDAGQQYRQQKEEVRAQGYDLTRLKLRPLSEGETSHVERRYQETGLFSFTGSEHIESIDDVAFIFKELENAAVENTFMVLEKDGVPTIVHLAIGNYDAAHAPVELSLAAAHAIGPDKVYFVHNHPSGNLKSSRQDRDLMKKFHAIFGDKLQEGIIIDTKSGKYGLFYEHGDLQQREMPGREAAERTGGPAGEAAGTAAGSAGEAAGTVAMKVYSFSKQVFSPDWNPEEAFTATSAQSIAEFVSSHRLGEHKKMSLIVIDQAGHVTGNIFLPWIRMKDAATREGADLIASYVNQMGGNRVVIYGNYEYTPFEGQRDDVKRLNNMLANRNVRVQDIIHIDRSAWEHGEIASEPMAMEAHDAVDAMLEEVERRKELSAKREAEDIISRYLSTLSGEHGEKQALATKAVLRVLEDVGVPYKIATRKEERQMMQLFSRMNEEAVKSFCRMPRMRALSIHGRGRYAVFNMNDPFGVPMYAEKRSVARWLKEGLQKYGGEWKILDIGEERVLQPYSIRTTATLDDGSVVEFMVGGESPGGEAPGTAAPAVGEKVAKNVVVETSDMPLPRNRKESLEAVSKLRRPFVNRDQGKEIKVSNNSVKHSATQDHSGVDVQCMGVIDQIIENAVKIGNIPVAGDEAGHTHQVEVYYCPVNIDGNQYSARLVVKQHENRGDILEDFRLYDLHTRKKKTDTLTQGTGQNALAPLTASVSGYKVKDLIHSTQENDQKVLGISINDTSFLAERGRIYGWSDGKQVYLTEAGLNPNTPIHECTHLWDKWCQKEEPELWQQLVTAMKKTSLWEELRKNPDYRNIWDDEDRMASEVHSRLSGAVGEEEFMKAAFKKGTPQKVIDEVKLVLRRFWEAVLRLFGRESRTVGGEDNSLDAMVRMPLRDLLNQDFEKVMRVAEGYADGMVEGHIVTDKAETERLDREPTVKGYRNVVLNEDGTLGSPMGSKLGKKGVGRRATSMFEFGKWERSDENPDLADENGKIDLIKPDGKSVGGVDYNPYIHIRPDKVNKQFKQAWERPNLIYVETEYPASELDGGYKAEKAAKAVGKHKWGTQGEYLILSRWDKPVRMVPWEEVADDWVKVFKDRGVEFDIVPPKLLPILAERGVEILPPHKNMGKACNEAYEKWGAMASQHTGRRALEDAGLNVRTYDDTGAEEQADANRRQAAMEAVGGRNDILFQKAGGGAEAPSEFDVAVRDKLIEDYLKPAGIEVITDVAEGQRVLDEENGKARLSKGKKKAAETAPLIPKEGSPADISTTDGAKIQKNLDSLAEKLEKVVNRQRNFLDEAGKALEAEQDGSKSWYKTFIANNGQKVTIRLGNHNATVTNFDHKGEKDGVSIVVSRRANEGMKTSDSEVNEGKAHVIEYFYPEIALRKAYGKPLADIVRAIKDAVKTGEYKDPTGLAEIEEVNPPAPKKFFRTADGEAYGYVKDGKIYIDPRIARADTPIHEYGHLWAAALRKVNPAEWKNIVGLMKGVRDVWDAVKRDYSELDTDDDIAEEVLAQYSGRRGRERFEGEKLRVESDPSMTGDEKVRLWQVFENIKKALHAFWNRVADFLHIHYLSAEQVADQVLGDLLSGINPTREARKYATEGGRIKAEAERKGTFMLAPDGSRSKLSEKQWVAARTKDFKKWLGGDWEQPMSGVDTKLDSNGEPQEKYVTGYLERPRKPGKPKKKAAETMSDYLNRLRLWERAVKEWPETEAQWKAVVASHDDKLLPDEEAVHDKWMRQYDEDLARWKAENGLPADAEPPREQPMASATTDPLEYVRVMADWRRREALWKTAPVKEDYERQAETEVYTMLAGMELKRHPLSYSARMQQMGASLRQLRDAVGRQRRYDKDTVKAVVDFAKNFMTLGFGDNAGRGDIEKILTSVKHAVGARSIRDSVDGIMQTLVKNHLRNLSNFLEKLTSVKDKRLNPTGVEVQGELDLQGQRSMAEFRSLRSSGKSAEDIKARLDELADKMDADPENMGQWEAEYDGAHAALTYAEGIGANQAACNDAENAIRDAVKEYGRSGRSYEAQQALLDGLHKGLEDLLFERMALYGQLFDELGGLLGESRERAKAFRENEKKRVFDIHRMAAIDLSGRDANETRKDGWKQKLNNSSVVRLPLSSLATFEQFMKLFGRQFPNGEGRLYNHYMRGFVDAVNAEQEGREAAHDMLDAKAREVFGKKRWSDLYDVVSKLPKAEVSWLDGDGNRHEYTLTQGNMLCIYMWDKMGDGRMKLRKMGIEEGDVARVKDFLDPRLVELADWVQDEFLPTLRTKYNRVHEEEFGASMAEIENYLPLRILKDAIQKEDDLTADPNADSVLPSTTTGSIIRRTVNSLPLDILNTDALSLVIEHVDEMEKWAAFTHWNKDVNTLLSYNRFKNQVKNMDVAYGSGDKLWDAFRACCQIAAGSYRPKSGPADKAMTAIASGVTGAKIAFRISTALKQLLSLPAILPEVNPKYLFMYGHPLSPAYWYQNVKWANENLPVLRKRWKSRDAGDTRLSDDAFFGRRYTKLRQWVGKWGMSANAAVDFVTCAAIARGAYLTKLDRYLKQGFDEVTAKKRALEDAAIVYNLTQQSSEGAMVSQIQKDRTFFANAWTVFRNSPMSYTRQSVDAMRTLRRMWNHRQEFISNQARMLMEEGLNEGQAKVAARADFRRSVWKNMAKLMVCAFVLPLLWELYQACVYAIFGDNDEKLKRMFEDALHKELFVGPFEGIVGGNALNTLWGLASSHDVVEALSNEGLQEAMKAALKNLSSAETEPLPLMADMGKMIEKFGYDDAAALQDLVNIAVQMGTGVNPSTLTDPIIAAIDACRGDLGTAKEAMLLMLRVLQFPSSVTDELYIDELGVTADMAREMSYDEMARRYADYKLGKNAPLFGWVYSDETEQKRRESYMKRFDQKVQERMGMLRDRLLIDLDLQEHGDSVFQSKTLKELKNRMEGMSDEDLRYIVESFYDSDNSNVPSEERRLVSKELARRMGFEKPGDADVFMKYRNSSKDKQKRRSANVYVMMRDYSDIVEDLELEKLRREAKAAGDDAREAVADDAKKAMREQIYDLGNGERVLRRYMQPDSIVDEEGRWRKIRDIRRKALEKLRRDGGE